MPKHSHDAAGRGAQVRARVADTAARFMLEHGIRDYALAKRKAARHLGVPEGRDLPSNEEVDQALIERRGLFEPEAQADLLTQLRDQALRVMRVFERFAPVLTGGVASGAISEHSAIELDIEAESSKDFEQFLLNQGIEFKVLDRGGQMAYLVYAQPADVMVRLPDRETRQAQTGHRPQLSLKQLSRLVTNNE